MAKNKISAAAQINPQGHDQQKNGSRRMALLHSFIVQRYIKTNELLSSMCIL